MKAGFVVLGGEHRGRRLEVPPGRAVRPTSVRVRKALFDLLVHSPRLDTTLAGAGVLDLFAGSGALGIEALSRGAAIATFVENNLWAIQAIKTNLASLGIEDRARILRCDVLRLPSEASPHDLCLADPPYGKEMIAPALKRAAETGWLAKEACAVAETSREETFNVPVGFHLVEERNHGRSRLVVLRHLA